MWQFLSRHHITLSHTHPHREHSFFRNYLSSYLNCCFVVTYKNAKLKLLRVLLETLHHFKRQITIFLSLLVCQIVCPNVKHYTCQGIVVVHCVWTSFLLWAFTKDVYFQYDQKSIFLCMGQIWYFRNDKSLTQYFQKEFQKNNIAISGQRATHNAIHGFFSIHWKIVCNWLRPPRKGSVCAGACNVADLLCCTESAQARHIPAAAPPPSPGTGKLDVTFLLRERATPCGSLIWISQQASEHE